MPQKLTPKTLKTAERRAKAFDLRMKGHSFRDIGRELGISHAAAHKHVQKGLENLAKTNEERATFLLLMEGARLDRLHQGCWDAAASGDLQAIDRVLKLMERRAKLFGLDAPNKVAQTNVAGTESRYDQMTEEEVDARIEELVQKISDEQREDEDSNFMMEV